MNGKMHSETATFSADGVRAQILNPFVHKLELDNTYDKIRTAIFTVILLPFRVIVICFLIVTAWFLACIGLHGLSEDDLREKPMTGWRSLVLFGSTDSSDVIRPPPRASTNDYNKLPIDILEMSLKKFKVCIKRKLIEKSYYSIKDYVNDKKAWV
ncbi:jg9786 [Pararge aegeria aegeria]|uniref:Jg9786 protein n=1 Tax=Pararge aegeria aegeria TaxID=348720 RepID=A0A8S4RIF8_9NEOP|nr:jg9786 [Pararge aegeria aegeria]